MYLEFEAEGQRLSYDGGEQPVAGTKGGWLRCRFALGGGWDGMRVAAEFDAGAGPVAALLEGGECAVPDEVTDAPSFGVRLVGSDGERVVTTSRARVTQEAV